MKRGVTRQCFVGARALKNNQVSMINVLPDGENEGKGEWCEMDSQMGCCDEAQAAALLLKETVGRHRHV